MRLKPSGGGEGVELAARVGRDASAFEQADDGASAAHRDAFDGADRDGLALVGGEELAGEERCGGHAAALGANRSAWANSARASTMSSPAASMSP